MAVLCVQAKGVRAPLVTEQLTAIFAAEYTLLNQTDMPEISLSPAVLQTSAILAKRGGKVLLNIFNASTVLYVSSFASLFVH